MKWIESRSRWLRIALVCLFLTPALPACAQVSKPEVRETMYEITPTPAAAQKTLGVLIFPNFEMLDAYGPMEIWGNLNSTSPKLWGGADKKVGVRVVTISAHKGEVISRQGVRSVADYGYDDAPQLDYILVPGGTGIFPLLNDVTTQKWLRERADKAELVMSVCNGASLLAASGLLDGHRATTNKMFWKPSTDPGPKVQWVKKARWVDDGKIVTSSGVSAGMDMSLAVIARLYGKNISAWVARVIEYTPHQDPSWDPFAKQAGLTK